MDHNPGALKRFWTFIRKPSAKYSLLAISSLSFVVGILFWGALTPGWR